MADRCCVKVSNYYIQVPNDPFRSSAVKAARGIEAISSDR